MTGFEVFKDIGIIASIVRTINALKDSNNSTAEDIFKESCIEQEQVPKRLLPKLRNPNASMALFF